MNRIKNANKIKITPSESLPNMAQTIIGWFQELSFGIVTTELVDYEQVNTIKKVKTNGVVQPYKPEPLEIQQAGVRSWSWLMIHCLPNLQLFTDDYIMYEGTRYKVLMRKDYSHYGYMEYTVCESFVNE